MDLFLTTLKSVLLLFLMALPGFIIAKKKLIDIDKSVNFISVVLLYVCVPFVTFDAFLNSTYDSKILINGIVVFVFTALFLTVFLIVNTKFMTLLKTDWHSQRQCAFGSSLSNLGYMGIPLMQLIAPGNHTLILYQSIALVAFNLVCWTIGSYQLSGDKKHISIKHALLNPTSISFLLILPFYITNTNFVKYDVPGLQHIFSMMAQLVGPLVMMLIGMKAAEISFKELFLDPHTYIVSGIKLVILPMVAFLLLELINLFYDVSPIRLNIMILASMPVANNLTVFSARLNLNTKYAAKIVILSMIFCIITVPVSLLLFM
ncbi:MAG TPA: hypothetical protein GX709_02620 [Clostridiales bacterium]|nr:hypothetical protein [Clostridiales bacterium]